MRAPQETDPERSETGESLAQKIAAYHAHVERELPRNFLASLAHGMLGQTGFRLMSTPTFVPAYVFTLAHSKQAVGLAIGAQFAGMALSSIWSATLIEHRDRVMNTVVSVGWLMRLQIFALSLSAFLLTGVKALVAAWICLMLFGFFSGMQGVAFNVLMSKVIPVQRRGSLVGLRNFSGGLIAAGVAYLGGTYLVGGNAFGNGYATTFMLAFILTSIGITALNFVREPKAISIRSGSAHLLERLRDIPSILRADASYRRFFFARGLGALGTAAVPFYILYVGKFVDLHQSGALGKFSLAFLLPPTVSNLLWGKIADAKGYRVVFLLSMVLWVLSTLLLISGSGMAIFLIAFGGLGAGLAGYQVASQNFVLEFGSAHELPMIIAISDTASHLMMVIGPFLGGVIADHFGYIEVFGLAIAFKLIAIWAVWGIQDPRKRTSRGQQHTIDES